MDLHRRKTQARDRKARVEKNQRKVGKQISPILRRYSSKISERGSETSIETRNLNQSQRFEISTDFEALQLHELQNQPSVSTFRRRNSSNGLGSKESLADMAKRIEDEAQLKGSTRSPKSEVVATAHRASKQQLDDSDSFDDSDMYGSDFEETLSPVERRKYSSCAPDTFGSNTVRHHCTCLHTHPHTDIFIYL